MRTPDCTLWQTLSWGLGASFLLFCALIYTGYPVATALLFSWIASGAIIPATAWRLVAAKDHAAMQER
ncbi:MAG: hypothetical protein AAF557_00940 [Pseudomonadota bacterium]